MAVSQVSVTHGPLYDVFYLLLCSSSLYVFRQLDCPFIFAMGLSTCARLDEGDGWGLFTVDLEDTQILRSPKSIFTQADSNVVKSP